MFEKRPDPLPKTPRQPLYLPPIPPPKMLTPAEAMKLWYHLQHEGDDSEFWHTVSAATPCHPPHMQHILRCACSLIACGCNTTRRK